MPERDEAVVESAATEEEAQRRGHSISYREIPELAAYIDRVGAVQINWRRFMVKTFRGVYYSERAMIRIDAEGKISCSTREHAPTKEEAEAIRGAVFRHSERWPKCVEATDAAVERELAPTLDRGSRLYRFYSRETQKVIMCQERRMIKRVKVYLPWTRWSDGEWRCMEPDDSLPFWKPRQKVSDAIMVHEGAKAAEFVHDLTTNPEREDELMAHPWGGELKLYEHWGMIGGALAPHRCRYKELIVAAPTRVVYVCDNDHMGMSALQEVSRGFRGHMTGIKFDKRFKIGWDMADPIPKDMHGASGRFTGPSLRKMAQPATWATEHLPGEGRGRPAVRIRSTFAEEWCTCVKPEVFIHRDFPSEIYTAPEFNNLMRPYSDVEDTARLLKNCGEAKSIGLEYSPAKPSGIYVSDDGRLCMNTYTPSIVQEEKGDASPFEEFMANLVPGEEDRKELMRWVATLVACPDVKMTYGVLLISEAQGVGKGTLGEKILAPILGASNVSYPSEMNIVESAFNYWASHKRLAICHEIYQGHSSRAYNKLKSIITDRIIPVNAKYMAEYQIENWLHIFACSNSPRALQISTDDRRWFVPRIGEKKKSNLYWGNLNRWLTYEGGCGIIRRYCREWVRQHGGVARGADAPMSDAKRAMVEESYSPALTMASELYHHLASRDREEVEAAEREGREPRYCVTTDLSVAREVRNRIYDGRTVREMERPLAFRKVARACGLHVGENKITDGLVYRGSYVISSSRELANKNYSELEEGGYSMASLADIPTTYTAA